jgi:D-glycero-D-manno-heptose 1,7-bisphosphate phosphatase
MRRAIFFDRDGTLIAEAPAGLASPAAHAPEHVRLLPGAIEAVQRAHGAGFLAIVVTNQPGPAKGQYSRAAVAATNAALLAMFKQAKAPIDAIYVCEHHETGGPGGDPSLIGPCECRKPKPGLLLQAARDLGIDLSGSAMIGDSECDRQAGRAAGVRCFILGDTGIGLLEAVGAAVTPNTKDDHAAVHRHEQSG